MIPKAIRERYGLDEGAEVEIIAAPDGITLIPSRTERRIVRRGRVLAIDTGAETAPLEAFDVESARLDRLQRASGIPE